MIRVSLGNILLIYLLAFMGSVLIAWALFELGKRRRENQLLTDWLRCILCGMEFCEKTGDPLPRCPRCGSLNERYRIERL